MNFHETALTEAEETQIVKISNERKFAALMMDLRKQREINKSEARYIVSMYYSMQEERIRQYARAKKETERGPEAHPETLILMARSAELFENEAKKALDKFSKSHPAGRWMREIDGIGPVTSAGLLAFVDINICCTAGKLWAFAGLEPGSKPKKGQKLTYNPQLKKLCYIIGEGFIKVSGKDSAFYGRIYKERKLYEQGKNTAGDYRTQAEEILDTRNIGEDTEAIKHLRKGMLTPAHIHARARRYAVKMFLSHLQQVWYEWEFREPAPKPFAIAHLGHVDIIKPEKDIYELEKKVRPF